MGTPERHASAPGIDSPLSPNTDYALPMQLHFDAYLSGDIIIKYGFGSIHAELIDALTAVKVEDCLNPSEPFSAESRKMVPKRQAWKKGNPRQALRPISQKLMNEAIENELRARGWKTQPVADEKKEGKLPNFRGDFFKNGIFVEVEFGNVASFYRDLFKFQVAHRSGVGEAGVVVTATSRTTSLQDSGQADFELTKRAKPYMRLGTSMPLWLIGLEPESFDPVEARYNEMVKMLTAHKIPAFTWEEYQAPFLGK